MTEKTETEDKTQYIKLTKNSRGYVWDIKINDLDVERITKLNEDLLKRFPDGVKNDKTNNSRSGF